MASDQESSVAGRLLARERSRRGWTAVELAERVESERLTRTVITNLESGRKRDLTVTEAMQLAAALDVSPLALMIDLEAPWSVVEVEGLAEPYRSMTNVEYVALAQVLRAELVRQPDSLWGLGELIDGIRGAESSIEHWQKVQASVAQGDAWERSGTAWRRVGDESGKTYLLSGLDSPVRATYADVLGEYQLILRVLVLADAMPAQLVPQLKSIPQSIWNRINAIGRVAEVMLKDAPAVIEELGVERISSSPPRALLARLDFPGHFDVLFTPGPDRRAKASRG